MFQTENRDENGCRISCEGSNRDKLHTKFTFSIVDKVNLEHFIRIDSEKSEFYM